MNRIKGITTIILMMVFSGFLFSQDIIIKKTGDEIKSKVIEITPTEIKYKNFENLNGLLYIILKSEVFMIKYENGTKDIFKEKQADSNYLYISTDDLFIKGREDAQRYYNGYKGAATGTFIIGLISPLVGLIPAIACSTTPPKEENLNYPKPDLLKNIDYKTGYAKKAKKIKQAKVWDNWGITFAINLLAVFIIASNQK